MKRTFLSLALAAGLFAAGSAAAWHPDAAEYDYARVVSVDPILDSVGRPVRREVCYNEPRRYYNDGYRRDSRTPAILGAIVGGAIGNQFGSGHGRDATTVAGAALGYSLARDQTRYDRGHDRGYSYGNTRRCEVRTDYRRAERVIGYDVGYAYNGRVYHTRTDYHPGRTIRVAVNVQAIN